MPENLSRSQIVARAQRPEGIRVCELTNATLLYVMAEEGFIFRAKVSHKRAPYFDTKARANAYVAANTVPKKVRQGRPTDGVMRITPETIFTYAPAPRVERFWTGTHEPW